MITAWSIDWLSGTFKTGVSDLDVRKVTCFGFPLKTWTQTQAKFGYAQAFTHPLGHLVMANYSRPEMGVHLAFGGRALKALAEGSQPATALLAWMMQQGAKITRLDLAIDVFDVAIDPSELAKVARVTNAPGSAKKWRIWRGEDQGCTAYIGSRKSEKFLRIYDKAAETGDHSRHWTRFELELKGDAARAAAAQMALLNDQERSQYIKGLIKGVFNPNDETFQTAMDGPAEVLRTTKDTEDNTLNWLLDTVARSIAKTMLRRADQDVWGSLVKAVHDNLVAMDAVELTTTLEVEDQE